MHRLPIDFVTRHAYATETPERIGRYEYQKLRAPEVFLNELIVSRNIIDSFPEYKGIKMHVTEFNTSYTPKNPIHDTNLNAAYIARILSEMGDTCASYSYWTFGDIFEEQGVAFTPFSGCFGLVANGLIKKPTFWTFDFYNRMKGSGIARTDHFVLTGEADGTFHGVAWNPVEDVKEEASLDLSIALPIDPGEYVLITKLVDEVTCNPLKVWLDLGSPNNPSHEQLELIRSCSLPMTATCRIKADDDRLSLTFNLTRNALLYFEIRKITPQTDRGFIPGKIQGAVV